MLILDLPNLLSICSLGKELNFYEQRIVILKSIHSCGLDNG